MERKKKKKKSSAVLIVVMVLCLAAAGFAVWKLGGIFMDYKAGTDEYDGVREQYMKEDLAADTQQDQSEEGEDGETADTQEQVQKVALSELQAVNPETVGWIEIPGTSISYPLMHTDNNSYYLNHTFSKKENSAGSIFVETQNSADFSDLHTIIYGHNMKNGSMFAGLKEYRSPSYYVDHPKVYLELADGTHIYEIFSVYEAQADSDSYTIGFAPDEQYEEFLQKLKDRSEYDTGVSVTKDDFIITLSTCTRNGENRYLVHAKKVS